jgi:RHS repeat-associated protein
VAKGTINSFSCNRSASNGNGFTATTNFIVGQDGEQLDELDGQGNPLHSNVYANGQLLATYLYSQSDWIYAFQDWLGTKRVTMDAARTATETCLSLPFGDALSCSGGVDPSEHHFTGKERDTETGFASGNDYFGARYYASSMGRFLSPDPLGGSPLNPQSLNRYGYAFNNPLTNTDPTGMYTCLDGIAGVCTSDQDVAFEKALGTLRGSSSADVARAAGAYGAAGDANGVTVGFADLSKSGEDGKVTSSLGVDANGNLQAQSDVTISTAASGASYDAAVGHEGSHVADAQDVVKSIVVDPATGNFTVGNNITRYQSEQRAYGVTNSILSSEGVNANEGCNGCDLGRSTMQGQVPSIVDRIMRTGNNYMSGGQHMGPKNQGGSVVNGVDQTPKAAVPH